MPRIPRDAWPDSTLALVADPYRFVARRCQHLGSDLFQTRILFRRTICMTGRDAAELFYDPVRFRRHDAPPGRIQKTLFGKGGVQSLDDQPHRHRKQMLVGILDPARVEELADLVDHHWADYAKRWTAMDQVPLYSQMRELLTRAVCEWAGIPLEESQVARRTRDLTALFDAAGDIGPRHWWSRVTRLCVEQWGRQIIDDIRAGTLTPPPSSAAHIIAHHQDLQGNPLPPQVAAVELLNILRPTVAVSVYVVFTALALHEHDDGTDRFARVAADRASPGVQWFVQEVRRFYPFFPVVAAVAREDVQWNGYHIPRDTRILLDLYGTNHDGRIWHQPDAFEPDRFADWTPDPYSLIPQGGADVRLNHRCPGENLTIELMKVAMNWLATGRISYDVPPQDLNIDFRRLPALPRSHMILRNVHVNQ